MDQGAMYDAADAQLQQCNREAQERAEAFFRWALAKPDCPVADAHAACHVAGICFNDVKPRTQQ